MAQSLVAVTALVTRGVVGGVVITITHQAPPGMGCRSYMQPAQFLIYESDTAAGAGTLVAETVMPVYLRTGLNDNPLRTRYYRAQVKDPAGNLGPIYPPLAQAGIAGTPTLDGVEPALDAQALIFDAKIADLEIEFSDETSALASRTSTLEARANNGTTGFNALSSRINIEQTARANAIEAVTEEINEFSATFGDATADGRVEYRANASASSLASYIDMYVRQREGLSASRSGVRFNSNGDIDFEAKNLRIKGSNGATRFAFHSDTGEFNADILRVNSIIAHHYLKEETISTGKVGFNQVTDTEVYDASGTIDISAGRGWVEIASRSVTPQGGQGNFVIIDFTASVFAMFNAMSNWGSFEARLYQDGSYTGRSCVARPDDENQDGLFVLRGILESPNSRPYNISVRASYIPSPGPGSNIGCRNRFMTLNNQER